MIFGHNYFISAPIFKNSAALFKTFGLKKMTWSYFSIFLVVFQKNEILKNAVSKRLYDDVWTVAISQQGSHSAITNQRCRGQHCGQLIDKQ